MALMAHSRAYHLCHVIANDAEHKKRKKNFHCKHFTCSEKRKHNKNQQDIFPCIIFARMRDNTPHCYMHCVCIIFKEEKRS